MKVFRKWCRILHRDIGYFFIGTSIIYGLSGIALNHINDWNPNYKVTTKDFSTQLSMENNTNVKENILQLLDEIDNRKNYKQHYYPNSNRLKIFLKGGSLVELNVNSGTGTIEWLKRRPIFYSVNFLHYNPHKTWMWFSDIFAGALILLAITSLFMVRGRKGIAGRGGIYFVAGVIIPLLFIIFLM